MAKKANQSFAGLGQGLINETQQPAGDAPKGQVTTFELSGELLVPLERVVFWMGKKGSKRAVINEALAYFFAHDANAKKRANNPTPDEE